jgi:hypothetical protein
VGRIVKSVGLGLLAAGALLVLLHFTGVYLRGGIEALGDALDPVWPKNYVALVPLAPGIILLWIAGSLGARADAAPPEIKVPKP